MIFNNYIFAILQEHTILFVRFQLLVNLLISRSDHISDKIEVNQLNLIFNSCSFQLLKLTTDIK